MTHVFLSNVVISDAGPSPILCLNFENWGFKWTLDQHKVAWMPSFLDTQTSKWDYFFKLVTHKIKILTRKPISNGERNMIFFIVVVEISQKFSSDHIHWVNTTILELAYHNSRHMIVSIRNPCYPSYHHASPFLTNFIPIPFRL